MQKHPDTTGAPYAEVIAQLTRLIEVEMERLGVPGLSIALVDDQEIIWEAGFGTQDSKGEIATSQNAVYRVGSISKVFTAVAVAQAADQGLVDLDAPVARYLPELHFKDPFASEQAITLRHLLAHRAGILRESPVGNFIDSSEPTIKEAVRSIIGSDLINPVGAATKYSNLGPTVAGLILERLTGMPFADYMQHQILDPVGMTSSSFLRDRDHIRRNLADAFMVGFDGEFFPAPEFAIGTSPAGNLYSTAGDLARFIMMFFNGGEAGGQRILETDTVAEMIRLQYEKMPEEPFAFGLGFMVGDFRGRPKVGHGGMLYGFASLFEALPEEKLAVVILNTVDAAFGLNSKISSEALRLMLNAKLGAGLAASPAPVDVPLLEQVKFDGKYLSGDRPAFVSADGDGLKLQCDGWTSIIRALPDGSFITDGRGSYGIRIVFRRAKDGQVTGFEHAGHEYTRVEGYVPDRSIPEPWSALVGDYGPPYNLLRIFVLDGQLWCQVEVIFQYPMTGVARDRFVFPDYGAYSNEDIRFKRGASGRVTGADMASVYFPRMSSATPKSCSSKIPN